MAELLPPCCRPAVSPGRPWVAWSWSRLGPAADVFAAPADGSRASPPSDGDRSGTTRLVSWTPDGAPSWWAGQGRGRATRLFRVGLAEPGVMEPLTEAAAGLLSGAASCTPTDAGSSTGRTSTPRAGEEIETDRLYRHDLRRAREKVLARPEKGSIFWPELNASRHPRTLRAQRPGPGGAAGLARGHRGPERPRDPELRPSGQGLGFAGSPTGAGPLRRRRRAPTAGWACGAWTKNPSAGS